jgi:hypothetical protein
MPVTGSTIFPSATANSAYLARVNFLAEEPAGGNRFFANDLNGPLYILDKATKQFTSYLNFNGRDTATGMFDKFVFASGFANGLITFQFDPDYRNNGKFYTVHMEQTNAAGSLIPNNATVPGLNTAGYMPTTAVTTPGGSARQTVLIQWTDTNINNATFEGTARELLRVNMSGQIHPMGDLIFNPLAQPGDPDWRVMYISIGDGGAGEQDSGDPTPSATRMTPQRLDTLGGKVLRIIPDLNEHTDTSTIGPNSQYRIPNDNPYTSINNAAVRDELFAVGLRNPHRMSWDVDPNNPENNHLIVNDIGLHTWEEVNIIYPGRNYGYSEREGNERLLLSNNLTGPLPNPDTIPVRITNTVTDGTIVPTYPVAQYGHGFADSQFIGDSISSGYVYRGTRIPELYGKYIFGEITTGQIFYCDYDQMLAADDGNPNTMAQVHSLKILWDNPNDAPNQGLQEYSTTQPGGAVLGPMFQIIERAYEFRGGQDPELPGSADVTSPNGRADIRLQVDEAGELYILSKSDGMIRAIIGAAAAPLTLTVDRATGAVSIRNPTTGTVEFGGYLVRSASGALDPANDSWKSLADQGLNGWVESMATANQLSELNAASGLQLAQGTEQSIGNPYAPNYTEFGTVAPEDLQFQYETSAGVVHGNVQYVGVDVNNNLVLKVDPATGFARLVNTSSFDVEIDGYSILSESGALEPADGNWLSFTDRPLEGWVEAAPTATELSELNPEGEMQLESGAALSMGRLFDPAGDHDLELEFVIAGEEPPRMGIVIYESFGLAGDYNANGIVDAADYILWRNTIGQNVAAFSGADGDGNGTVDEADYEFWRARYGNTLSTGAGAADGQTIPEATTAALIVAAACCLGRRNSSFSGSARRR